MIVITNYIDKYVPIKATDDKVTVAFGLEYTSTDNIGTWCVHTFFGRPSFEVVYNFIISEINQKTESQIIGGFTWKDMPIWLSSENQFNYKAAYDLAVQTNGANLPVVFKFGSVDNPIYYTFETLEELSDFYLKAIAHINEQLKIGWEKKDSIDWEEYKRILDTLM